MGRSTKEKQLLCLFLSLRYDGIDLSLKLGTKCNGYAEVGAREGLLGRWPLNNVLRRSWKVVFVAWSHQRRHPERGAGGQVGEWEMVGKQRVLGVGVAQVSPLSPGDSSSLAGLPASLVLTWAHSSHSSRRDPKTSAQTSPALPPHHAPSGFEVALTAVCPVSSPSSPAAFSLPREC